MVITVWADSGFQTRISGKAITCGLSANHPLGPEKAVPGDAEWKSMGLLQPEDRTGLCDLSPAHSRVWLVRDSWMGKGDLAVCEGSWNEVSGDSESQ